MTIIDETTVYDRSSFQDALSSWELLPARYYLEKVTKIYVTKNGRQKEETTYSLHKTNVVVIALKRLWRWINRKDFDKTGYDITKIANTINGYFCTYYMFHKPSNRKAIIGNLTTLGKNLRKAAEVDDQKRRESFVKKALLVEVGISLIGPKSY